ncbi:flagellar hook-associated protein FlgL [Paraburkholderia sp. SARCC-3016]|uniref:flagellar hook-associated protein FlgL n=1 Tax=Paraburkholderia sp. SARCC-3016 TaxID=3058611 RepID=UPI00280734C7|nr:flagellar hook-associated protein FlgL [Paraburkholderia sp. SARCC-3016]MDQ7979111.1 flagellar hook-associated protein FlgL [Paraburkholderia sp. SARCC-3016]
MRIATTQIYANTISNMDNQQSLLARLEQQASTGIRVATAADDPLGAAQAVQLSATGSVLSQFASNQNTAISLLQTEDTTLSNVSTALQNVLTQLNALGSGTINDSNRQAAGKALQGLRDQLMTLANTTDGTGNFIFSGFQGGTAPFSNASNGGVTYNGDLGTRTLQISNTTSVATTDNGASVFLSVLPGLSDPVPAGASTNAGTGVIGPVSISTQGAASNNKPYSITFLTDPTTGNLDYQVNDTSTTPPTAIGTPQAFTAGQPIDLGGGESVAISGTPVAGDSFTVTPAAQGNTDVFKTIDDVIAALQNPAQDDTAAMATIENAINTAHTQIDNTMTNVATVHASVAGREQQVTALGKINSQQSLQTTTDLTDITQADPSTVFSQLTLQESMLSATETTFASVSKLSLFSMITP